MYLIQQFLINRSIRTEMISIVELQKSVEIMFDKWHIPTYPIRSTPFLSNIGWNLNLIFQIFSK